MQYLTFSLNDSTYAVPVTQVREVLGYTTPQELPCADPVISGLIRSRNQSISVLNLRRKFGFPDVEISKETKIIVEGSEESATFYFSVKDKNFMLNTGYIQDEGFVNIEISEDNSNLTAMKNSEIKAILEELD